MTMDDYFLNYNFNSFKQKIMKTKLLFKSLLVAAGLCVGQSAWAGVVTLFSQNYETATDASSWVTQNLAPTLETGDATYGKYIKVGPAGSTTNTRSSYTVWGSSFYDSYTTYTLEFDANFTVTTSNTRNQSSSFTVMADVIPSANSDYASKYLFRIVSEANTTTFKVNGSETSFTMPVGVWCHYTIEVDGANGTAKYTIINKSTTTELATGTYDIPDGTSYKAAGMYYLCGRYNSIGQFDNISITTEVSGDVANDPTISLTGVDGTSRTYLISYTDGETLHYTLPGGSEQTVSTGSSYVVTATTSGKLSAYTTNGTATSNTVNETVDATAITLNAPTYSITAMTETGTRYYPTYNATSSQTDKLLSPTATITATFNGSDVVLPYKVTEAGTLTITASAAGYTSASTDIVFATAPSYVLANSADFTEINSSNIATKLGANWTIGSGATRWTSWNKNGGINAAGESTGDDKYYVASTTDEFPLNIYSDFVKMSTGGTNLIIGWGFGRNNNTAAFSLPGADTEGVAQYIESDYGNAEYSRFVTGVTDLGCTTYTCGVIKGVKYYIPLVATIPVTIAASGYSSIASAYALDCEHLPAGLEAYKVTGIAASAVTLEQVTEAVAPGTGLILKGTASTAYNIPVVATGSDISATNYLKAAVAPTTLADGSFYILKSGEFHKVIGTADEDARTIPAGKAYLLATDVPSEAPALNFVFAGSETTGINAVNGSQSMVKGSQVYNLAGQRVAQPTRGLYIVNGKKVVVK